jgi:hypothetical protein
MGGVAELVGLFDATEVAGPEVVEVLPEIGDRYRGHGYPLVKGADTP